MGVFESKYSALLISTSVRSSARFSRSSVQKIAIVRGRLFFCVLLITKNSAPIVISSRQKMNSTELVLSVDVVPRF